MAAVRTVATIRPVLVAVDDAHWLDHPTAKTLAFVVRRLAGAWPRVVRIAELSEGNPLYVLELTRAFGGVRSGEDLQGSLPKSVVELTQSRIAKLPGRVREAVELASVPRAPTLDLLRRLDSGALDLHDALVTAARIGIVTIDGERILFSHPILAAAVYGSIPSPRKREPHRAVGVLSDDLEERAAI